jgi:hypothetical protein
VKQEQKGGPQDFQIWIGASAGSNTHIGQLIQKGNLLTQ